MSVPTVAVVLSAVQALQRDPNLAGHVQQALAIAALGLASAASNGAPDGRIAARLTHLEEALGLCGCQLGLRPDVLRALHAADRLRASLRPIRAARSWAGPVITLEPLGAPAS